MNCGAFAQRPVIDVVNRDGGDNHRENYAGDAGGMRLIGISDPTGDSKHDDQGYGPGDNEPCCLLHDYN